MMVGAKSSCLALIFNLWAFPPNDTELSRCDRASEGAVGWSEWLGRMPHLN